MTYQSIAISYPASFLPGPAHHTLTNRTHSPPNPTTSLATQANALEPLLTMLKDKKNCSRRAREYVAGALMNLTLRQPTMQADVAKAGAVPLLVGMLQEVSFTPAYLCPTTYSS